MRTRRWTFGAVALVAFAMVASACSDVSSSTSAGGDHLRCRERRPVRERADRDRGEPVGRGAGQRRGGAGRDAGADGLHGRAEGPAQREGTVPRDGRRDRSMRPSRCGRRVTRRTARTTSIRPAPSWMAASSGSPATSAGSCRSTWSTNNPQYATWEGLQGQRRHVRDGRDGRQGPVPRRRHDLLDLRRADHRGAGSGSRGGLLGKRGGDVGCRGHRDGEPGADPACTGGRRSGRTRSTTWSRSSCPTYTDECADIALNDPEAIGYNCDYADDVLYKAFSSELEAQGRRGVRVPVELQLDGRRPERGGPGDPRRDRPRAGRPGLDRREPGAGGELGSDRRAEPTDCT